MSSRNPFREIPASGRFLALAALAVGLVFAVEPSPPMSRSAAKELISKASTPADHQRIAAYFRYKADVMEAEAVEHDELAAEYAKNPNGHDMKHPMSGKTAEHCKYFAQAARKAASEDRLMAAAHEAMAKGSK
jgi:hypothetical protein